MKVLVLGGAGMLGHQIFSFLKENLGKENVACTLRKSVSSYARFELFQDARVFQVTDVSDFLSLEAALDKFKPQVIVNCVGLTLRKKELSDIEKCIEVNSMLPHRLAKWGLQNGCRIIHFSTDCVFDGVRGGYTELDIPSAKDIYGKSKFLGEIGYSNSLTLRLSIVGRELEGKTELVEWFLAQRGKSVQGFSNVFYTGLTTNRVAKEVYRLLTSFPTLSGVYQLSSERISKLELLKILNEIYHVGAEINAKGDYVSDKSLRSDVYSSATGFKSPSWREMLEEMKNEERVNYGQ